MAGEANGYLVSFTPIRIPHPSRNVLEALRVAKAIHYLFEFSPPTVILFSPINLT